MITQAFLRSKSNGAVLLFKAPPGERVWAKWKVVTVDVWDQIVARDAEDNFPGPADIEERLWKFALLRSSILRPLKKRTHNKEGVLNDDAMALIFNVKPPQLMSFLVSTVLHSVHISEQEEQQIKFECQMLWSGKSSVLKAPHPLLEEAVEMMSAKERYGIPRYRTLKEIPQRVFSAMRLVSGTYSDIMEMNTQSRVLQERARQLAGIPGKPTT